MIRLIAHYMLSLLVFNCAACSSMQTVSIRNAMNHSPPRGVEYGSLVQVRMLDKREAKFRVTEIMPDGLGGNAGFFRYEEMESLKVEGPDHRQTNWTAVLLAIVGIAGLIFVIGNADSVRLCSGTPCPPPNP